MKKSITSAHYLYIQSVSFSDALYGLKIVKTYLIQQDVNDTVCSYLHEVENELLRVRIQRNCQMLLSKYFKYHIIQCVIIHYIFSC